MATDVNPVLPVLLKVQVQENWYPCMKTMALLYYEQEHDSKGNNIPVDVTQLPSYRENIPLDDPSGMINFDLGAEPDEYGNFYIPSGRIILVARPQDAFDGHYEILHSGLSCTSLMSAISEMSSEISELQSQVSEQQSEISSLASQCEGLPNGPMPDGNCPGWVAFNDCEGNPHYYWGS